MTRISALHTASYHEIKEHFELQKQFSHDSVFVVHKQQQQCFCYRQKRTDGKQLVKTNYNGLLNIQSRTLL